MNFSINPANQLEKTLGSLLLALFFVIAVLYRFVVYVDNGSAVMFQPVIFDGTLSAYVFFAVFAIFLPIILFYYLLSKFGFLRFLVVFVLMFIPMCFWIYGLEGFVEGAADLAFKPHARAYANDIELASLYVMNAFLVPIAIYAFGCFFSAILRSGYISSITLTLGWKIVLISTLEAILCAVDLNDPKGTEVYMDIFWILVSLGPIILIAQYFFVAIRMRTQQVIDLEKAQKEWNNLYSILLKEFDGNKGYAKAATEKELGPYPTGIDQLIQKTEAQAEVETVETVKVESDGKLPFYQRFYTSFLKILYKGLEKIKPKPIDKD
jgi:hypothetical protein